jgi:hypothetical protein
MNTNVYAVLKNVATNKTTTVLVRNGKISHRQCHEAIKRVSNGDSNRFNITSDRTIKVLGSTLIITPNGPTIDNVDHIIQNSQKRYTVVYRIDETSNNNFRINYGLALTAPNDNFSRKLGRTIATGRLNSGKAGNVSSIELTGAKIPSNGKQWHDLEKFIMQVVESKHRRKG